MTDRIRQLACQALWVQVATEARAAGLAHLLGASPILTPEERDFYRDVMGPDERRHSRICHDLARQLGKPDAIAPGIFHEERADLEKVVSMLTVERLFVRGIDRAVAFFGQWGREFAEGFRLIEREERPHIVHGRAVLRRLVRDPEVAAAARRFRGAAVAGFRTELVAPFAEIVGGPASGGFA